MSVRVEFNGLEEFREALRNLPAHLADEAGGIVTSTAEEAGRRIVDLYATVSGDLKDGVKVKHERSGVSVKSTVVSRSPHAHLYENGTQARHNAIGANRGAMPAKHTVAKTASERRQRMHGKLIELLQRNGFQVTGG